MNVLIICASPAPIGSIVAGLPGATVTCLTVGPRPLAEASAAGAPASVSWIDTDGHAPEAFSDCVAAFASGNRPDLIVCTDAPQDRALAAAAAGAIGAAWTPSLTRATTEGDTIVIEGPALEGRVVETVAAQAPVAAVYTGRDEGITGEPCPIETVESAASTSVEVVSAAAGGESGSIATAHRVVGVGRGVTSTDLLPQVDALASAIGAGIGCTLPVNEDLHWYDAEHLIGRSGYAIKSDLYLALGIAGQPQHLDGIRDVRVVAAVNADPEAPIFRRAGYGIVADTAEALPALIEALSA